jgi:hypothetical protein
LPADIQAADEHQLAIKSPLQPGWMKDSKQELWHFRIGTFYLCAYTRVSGSIDYGT